jgi:hypothetical protein
MRLSAYFFNYLFLISLLCPFLFADTVEQNWNTTFNGNANSYDSVLGSTTDLLGNVYVTGKSVNSATGYDTTTIKYNSAGIQQWIQTYDGGASGSDQGEAIAVDSAGNVYVAGYTTTTYPQCTLLKYNSSGVLQWVRTYAGPNCGPDIMNIFKAVAVDSSNNVYVTGYCENSSTSQDYVTIKYNSAGVQQWIKTYDAGSYEGAYCLALDSSANVYVCGNAATIKYDTNGAMKWTATDSYMNNRMTVDKSGNVYVFDRQTRATTDLRIIKYDNSGVKQWSVYYDTPENAIEESRSITTDSSGNIYASGWSYIPGKCSAITLKYDPNGNQKWVNRYILTDKNIYSGPIKADVWGNVYVIINVLGNKLITIKYDSLGNQKWQYEYPAFSYEFPVGLNVDSSGNVCIAAPIFNTASNYDFLTFKLSQHFCKTAIKGDFNNDCTVNFEDFAEMSANWLSCSASPSSDCAQ